MLYLRNRYIIWKIYYKFKDRWKECICTKYPVIIPVYNAEKTLPDTLKSTAAQSLSDIEIICVDDGSTDQSFKIIKNWQAVHSNIRCVRQQNGGAGSARNRGMDMAARRIYCIHGCG